MDFLDNPIAKSNYIGFGIGRHNKPALGMNILASDQYMAIIIPGRMYRTAFIKRNLHPKNLSRALEDSATLTSPLIPWNTCGAHMSGVLGVGAFTYLPFAFLNLASPLISIFYGFSGITIQKIEDDPETLVGVTEEELAERDAPAE